MKLRPHHLLCTQGYRGRGYSSDFVENMTAITTHLRNSADAVIEVVFSADDICSKCPRLIENDVCASQDKIERFDKKIIAYFDIEEKCYAYQDIIRKINSKMTSSIMDDICGDCEWYPISDCKRSVLAQRGEM